MLSVKTRRKLMSVPLVGGFVTSFENRRVATCRCGWQLLVEVVACLILALLHTVAAVGAASVIAADVPIASLMTIRRGTELTAHRGAE